MKINASIVLLTVATLPLIGCGWVDSTGTQSSNPAITTGSIQSAPGNDLLTDDGAVMLNEATTARLLLVDAPVNAGGWTWRSETRNDSIVTCDTIGNFDSELAVTQLNQACTDDSNCDVLIQEFDNNGRTEFDLTLPVLKAPVALSFSLEATLPTGELHTQSQTVCAAAINEAPNINDNEYRTLTTQTREVTTVAYDAIFSNDSDDEHVRNQPLFVKEVTNDPLYAENFVINTDGSFRYKAFSNLDISNRESLVDRINIIISDGVHDVESSITMSIVSSNEAPALQQSVPDFTLTPSDSTTATLNENLAPYFDDADGDTLYFRLEANELTDAGLLSLDDNGVLSGTFSTAEFGTVPLTVMVSDGLEQIEARFNVTVRDNQLPNRAPTVGDISNVRFTGPFSYDVSVFFSDPDGDTLRFSSEDLPPHVSLSDNGMLTGVATDDNDGQFLITVTASDNRGGTVADSFLLIIDN